MYVSEETFVPYGQGRLLDENSQQKVAVSKSSRLVPCRVLRCFFESPGVEEGAAEKDSHSFQILDIKLYGSLPLSADNNNTNKPLTPRQRTDSVDLSAL